MVDNSFGNLATQLNSEIARLQGQNLEIKYNYPIFYSGESISTISNILQKVSPCGKVAVIYKPQTFAIFGKDLTNAIKGAGCRPCNFIMPESNSGSGYLVLEQLSELFFFPEDIRAVVSIDACIVYEVCYYASILNIPAIYTLNNQVCENLLPCHAYIKNGSIVDLVSITCERHIVIDQKAIFNCQDNSAQLFAYQMSKIPAFVDFRINNIVKDNSSFIFAYNYARAVVLDTFNVFKYEKSNQLDALLLNGLKLEVANYFSKGTLFDFSAVKSAQRILKKSSGILALNLAKKIIGLYNLYFSGQYQHNDLFVDYFSRAQELSVLTGEKDTVFATSLLNQIKLIKKHNSDFAKIKDGLSKEVQGLEASFNKISNLFIALNGKQENLDIEVNKSIKYCGDLNGVFNAMTLVRDSGISELI